MNSKIIRVRSEMQDELENKEKWVWALNYFKTSVKNSMNYFFYSPSFKALGYEWNAELVTEKEEFCKSWNFYLKLIALKPETDAFKGNIMISFFDHITLIKKEEFLDKTLGLGTSFPFHILWGDGIEDQKLLNSRNFRVQFEFFEIEKIHQVEELYSNELNMDTSPPPPPQLPAAYRDFSNFNPELGRVVTTFEILSEGKLFRVHKSILAAQSTVFREMFTSRDINKKMEQNQLKIENFSAIVVEAMIDFLYTGQIEKWPKEYADLFDLQEISEEYKLEEMRKICNAKLIDTLLVTNF